MSYLEDEKKQLHGQIQQVQGAKKKLLQMIDRLDNLYDRISELDEEILKIVSAYFLTSWVYSYKLKASLQG